MAFMKKKFLVLLLSVFLMASCGFGPPLIDMSRSDFPVQGLNRFDPAKLLVQIGPNVTGRSNFESRINYSINYVLRGTEVPYTEAVSRQLTGQVPQSDSTDTAGKAVLTLTSLTHNAFLHDSGDLPDVTEEIVAVWELTDPDGTVVENFTFLGQETGPTEWGTSALPKSIRKRSLAAMTNLYAATIDDLVSSAKLHKLAGN